MAATRSADPAVTSAPVYSEVMEDGDVIANALRPRAGEIVVSVASAGDNVFQLALSEARHVFGVDLCANQIEFCRLKESALGALAWDELAGLLGLRSMRPDERRRLLDALPDRARFALLADAGARAVIEADGLAACGQLSAFVAPLREGLQSILGVEILTALLTSADASSRARIWNEHGDTPAVVEFLAAALNEETISEAFIPASAFSRMAEPHFHLHYHRVLRHLCVELDPRDNHFLHRLWLGRFPSPDTAPAYLRRENHARLRDRLTAITWHSADLLDFLRTLPSGSAHAFNLSNILDWSSAEHERALWGELDRVAADGARVFLRSFLARAEEPEERDDRWSLDPKQSEAMARADRVGYFSRYELWTRARTRE
jgi:S-adenosylmethionine:diacylglycerol 3-amino-3-carboxypropyl transferase